jgi:hypothetical protein
LILPTSVRQPESVEAAFDTGDVQIIGKVAVDPPQQSSDALRISRRVLNPPCLDVASNLGPPRRN